MILNNCNITGGTNATITKEYVDSIRDPLYKQYKGFHDGVDIKARSVYSFCPGIVIAVGTHYNGITVTVRCADNHLMQYCYLRSTDVRVNDEIDTLTRIGQVNDVVHIEYLSLVESKWPVRIVDVTFYKNNPMTMLQTGPTYFLNYKTDVFDSYEYTEQLGGEYNPYSCIPQSVIAEVFGDNR